MTVPKYLDSKRLSGLSSDVVDTSTFTDSLPTATGWTFAAGSTAGAQNAYAKIETDSIRCIDDSNGTGYSVIYDLGSALSNKWVIRFKLTTNITASRSSNQAGVAIGIFSLPETTTGNTSQDSIAFLDYNDTSSKLYASYTNGQAPSATPNTQVFAETTSHANGSYWWCEMSRDEGTTTFKLFSDSTYSTLLETETRTTSTTDVTGLRYFGAKGFSFTDASSKVDCSVSGINIYDGITSLSSKPTNVQDNSILVEKYTAKRFWFAENKISTTGLKGYYNFNESSGNLINQSTTGDGLGSSADGTNTSVSYSQTGKIGNAYTYTRGTSKTVLGSSLSQFNFMHNQSQLFSINLWYKLSGSLVNVTGMMGNGQDDTAKIGLSIYAVATGALSINTTNGSGQDALITAGGVIPDNTDWHMLTVTYNRSLASSNWLTYIDGVLVATINKSGSFTPSNSNASHAMELGTYGVLAQSFFGTLDECSIWNRVLTTSEISALYNSGSGSIVSEANNATWTMEPTFEDDFTSYADQTAADLAWVSQETASTRVNITNDNLAFSVTGTSNKGISYDLGVGNVSDTTWILQYTLAHTTYTNGSGYGQYWIGLSSADSATLYGGAQDSISSRYNRDTAMRVEASDNSDMANQVGTDGVDLANNTTYYVDLIRDGTSITRNIYTDSARTGTIFSTSTLTITGTITGLRYFVLRNDSASGTSGHATGTIDDVKFYDGVTSIN